MDDTEIPYQLKKHEAKSIQDDANRVRNLAQNLIYSVGTYRQLGLEEAARRANDAQWILAHALEVLENGAPRRI